MRGAVMRTGLGFGFNLVSSGDGQQGATCGGRVGSVGGRRFTAQEAAPRNCGLQRKSVVNAEGRQQLALVLSALYKRFSWRDMFQRLIESEYATAGTAAGGRQPDVRVSKRA